jgi:probable phosphoglycerate mutase
VLLWRHGRTGANADGRFQGQQDVPLDDVGLIQAKAAAATIAERLDGGACRIVTSDLSRAVVTARALSERTGEPFETDPDLREVYAGAWEGLLRAEIMAGYPEEFAAWQAGDDIRVGGGERRTEAGARAARAVTRHADAMDGGTLVAVSHGAALRCGLVELIGGPAESWHRFEGLRNAHWATITRRRDAWVLSDYNVGPSEPGGSLLR